MNAESYASWKNVYQDFLKSGSSKENYCQKKGLAPKWFERQCRKAETYERRFPQEKQEQPDNLKDLFVELISEEAEAEYQHPDAVPLKLTYREVTFELRNDFEDVSSKRALQAVREIL